jgi:hypothetical protein
MACVVSMNHIEPSYILPQVKNVEWKPEIKLMAAYMIFGVLWVTAFFEYCATFVTMVAASTYYWTSSPTPQTSHLEFGREMDWDGEGSAEISLGFSYCFTHFGSIAIGSFIIAVIRFLKLTVMYLA